MIDAPKILNTEAQATAVIHVTVPREQIREVMGPGLKELLATLAAQGITPTGRWFTHHFKMDPKTFDFEIGVPVDKPVAHVGRVTGGQLPATRVARTVYHGGYEGLPGAWGEFMKWIAAEGHTAGESLWETYVTDPSLEPDQTRLRTELTRPLADGGAK